MWSKSNVWLKLMPATLVMMILFIGGMGYGWLQSLGLFAIGSPSQLSITAYERILTSEDFWNSLVITLRVAVLSTLLSSGIGLGVALFLYIMDVRRQWKWLAFWRLTWQLPLLVPHMVAAYFMVVLFVQSGWVSRLLYTWGWIDQMDQFPILIHDQFGWGIIMAYTWKEAPFVIMLLMPILYRIHMEWFEVARTHGASLTRYVFEVVMPLLLPALGIVAFIVFAYTFSAYEIPALLGVTYPKLLAVYGFELYQSSVSADRQAGLAVYLGMAFIVCFLGFGVYRSFRKWLMMYRKSW